MANSMHSSQPLYSSSIGHHHRHQTSSHSTLPASFKLGRKLFRKKVTANIAVSKPNPTKLQQLITKKEQDPLTFSSIESPKHTNAVMNHLQQQIKPQSTTGNQQNVATSGLEIAESSNSPEYSSMSPEFHEILKALQTGAVQLNQIELIPDGPQEPIMNDQSMFNLQTEIGLPQSYPPPQSMAPQQQQQTQPQMIPKEPNRMTMPYVQSQPLPPMIRHQAPPPMISHPQYPSQSLPQQQQQQQYGQIYGN
ncbi:hypothetical protein BLA29_008051, partial [Euroglyphus maynei]